MNKDIQQLNLLSILHYIWGALTIVGGLCGGGVFFTNAAVFANNPSALTSSSGTQIDPSTVSALAGGFIGIGIFVLLLCAAIGILTILAGRNYKKRKGRTFCFAIAIVELFSFPLGTALGIFALVVLSRESVKAIFSGQVADPTIPPAPLS